jgi:hypothetical protein
MKQQFVGRGGLKQGHACLLHEHCTVRAELREEDKVARVIKVIY